MMYRPLDARTRRWPKSASAPGAWAGGAGLTTRRREPRCAAVSNWAATSSIRPAPTGTATARRLIGEVLARLDRAEAVLATKIPPKNGQWPARAEYPLDAVFPADHIRSSTEQSLAALGVASLDLQQFHVWTDAWAEDDSLAACRRRPQGGRPRQGGRASASTGGSLPTSSARSARGSSMPSRSSTTSSIRRPRTSCSRSARNWVLLSSPGSLRRGKPDGHDDRRRHLAEGRLA